MATKAQSKLLSLILRHAPEQAGLSLGPGGWVEVDALLSGLASMGHPISLDTLTELVATSDKKRFTLSQDGKQIRAAQGHSVEFESDLAPKAPPGVLFHGTATRFLPPIQAEGLKPMDRMHVHLSGDTETATKVGQRHGKPVVLTIEAQKMAQAGHDFFQADNGVWLTGHVPPAYIEFEGSI